ncbi:PF20097 family protein [Ruminococcus flavefaciens]|uniref:PF20097 family protein n=1 Tax=Ruminococcus flavefaciens TaxID=1265 RepID=UPI000685C5A4|nr:PF20097 family protein [Ruminococcus flavefaciens]
MNCPECGKECRKGFIEAKEIGSITQFFTSVIWYPEDEKDKWIRNNTVHLSLHGEGYYCDECMKVFAAFDEK